MLPNLIVIGAAKAGTSSFHHYLGLHPEVYMSRQKELQLFDRADWRERLDWYDAQFPVTVAVRGESSPAYSMHPAIGGVPERMHSLIPEARLVYLVRDPIERLVAHYVEWFSLGLEHRTLDEAMREDPDRNAYLCASRYASQLAQYRNWFPESHVLVIDHDDLLQRRAATLAGAYAFLGVDPAFASPEFDRELNPRERKWRLNAAGWWLVGRGGTRAVRSLQRLPAGLRDQTLRVVARRVETPTLDPGLRQELVEIFRGETSRLRAETGQRFASWSV